jgi:hypothetical protein
MVAVGGGGLLGGLLIGEAIEHHEDREREEAYDQGFDQGQLSPASLLCYVITSIVPHVTGFVDGNDFGGGW